MYEIVLQRAADDGFIPANKNLRFWGKETLKKNKRSGEVTIRIVNIDEMTNLNETYRKKNGPTNVLAFPFEPQDNIQFDLPILGDVVICAEIVNREAAEQMKKTEAHWAHMIVHGILHLLGHDHQNEIDANIMEALESKLLAEFGFDNPYEGEINIPHD